MMWGLRQGGEGGGGGGGQSVHTIVTPTTRYNKNVCVCVCVSVCQQSPDKSCTCVYAANDCVYCAWT